MSRTPLNLRRELVITLIAICGSVLVLPGLIFAVGSRLFGAYGSTGGVFSIYQAVLNDLLALRFAAWIIIFGPALCIALLRLIFRLTPPDKASEPEPAPERTRREPTLNA